MRETKIVINCDICGDVEWDAPPGETEEAQKGTYLLDNDDKYGITIIKQKDNGNLKRIDTCANCVNALINSLI